MTLRYGEREFLRRNLRQRADYFANQSLAPTVAGATAAELQGYAVNSGKT